MGRPAAGGTAAAGERAEAARRHFDRFSGIYGRLGMLQRLQAEAIELLAPRPGEAVLDVACGVGTGVAALLERGVEAAGTDLSPAALERARALAGARAELREASAEALPFESERFDAVLCTSALHHFPDPRAAVAEMARVVRPGGRVAIGDFRRDPLVMRVADVVQQRIERGHVGYASDGMLRSLLAGAGLEPGPVRRRLLGGYGLVRAERPAG